MLKEDSVRLARSLHATNGPMPLIWSHPPIQELFEYEGGLRKCKTVDDAQQHLRVFVDNHDSYWGDWAIVLTANHCGKLKAPTIKGDLLGSTEFKGYHIF